MSRFIMIDLAPAVDADRRRESRNAIVSRRARKRAPSGGSPSGADEPAR